MIAVCAAVKDEDGKVRAEKFLLTDEEANELRGTHTDRIRPWTWVVTVFPFAPDAYEENNHYARWWWDEWERRERGEDKLHYVPDARTWHRQDQPRCPWCDQTNVLDDEVGQQHLPEETRNCEHCSQPFSLTRYYFYTTSPVRND